MLLRTIRPEPENQEEGYVLLTVLVMVFLMLLALSVAAPRVAKEIQRDKELETVERGLQYKRAIHLYYKKFGAYPTDIKQLEKTNEIRFLRKRYKDPMTGQDDWRLIHMGEAKVPPMGFFGQPLAQGMSSVTTGLGGGLPGAGSGATGAGGDPGSAGGAVNGAPGNTTNSSGSGFGFNSSGNSSSGSGFGFSNSNTNTGGTGGFASNGTGTPGTGMPGTGTTGLGSNSAGGGTFGGGPIVGVGLPVKKESLITYHKQKKYSDWEFVYDPQEDLVMAGGVTGGNDLNGNAAGLGGNGSNPSNGSGPNSNGSSGSNGSGGFGFGNNGSSGGSGFGFGNSGSNPPSTPSPTPSQPTSPQ